MLTEVSTYLFERVLDDYLSICIWYSRKEISDGGVSLLVDFILVLRYWFRDVQSSLLRQIFHLAERLARLFDYRLPNVVADPVQGNA
jgi:hypothetical protein